MVKASIRPEGDKWVIDIEGWGVTQVDDLDKAEATIKDYIECMRSCDVRHNNDDE